MIDSIFKALAAGLQIWNHSQKVKYKKKFHKLKQEYYEESNKPENKRDHARLDDIEWDLHLLTNSFYTEIFNERVKDTD